MKVERLSLRNFRNIVESDLYPDPTLNFLLGKNGQGKTSFLEALSYLSTLRSFRGSKTPEVIRWGSSQAEISCRLSTHVTAPECGYVDNFVDNSETPWQTDLKISFAFTDPHHQKASKVAFINDKPYKSSTSYLTQRFGNYELGFHSVVFNPSDHDLVRADPATRRSYLDRVISAEDIDYLKTLQKYQRILEQRNALLKSCDKPQPDLLMGFTEPMSRYAASLTLRRLQWIHRLTQYLSKIVQNIAPNQPFLRLLYLSNWVPPIEDLSLTNNSLSGIHFTGLGPLPSLELLEQAFWKKLSSLEGAEWKSRHSLVGPHRDDWTFFLGDQVLKGHGSQGEVRSALLALKLSEVELFRNVTGHRPIFLLDDFSSELDRERRSFLLGFLAEKDLQVFVTTTDDSFLIGKHYWVVNGTLRESPRDEAANANDAEKENLNHNGSQ